MEISHDAMASPCRNSDLRASDGSMARRTSDNEVEDKVEDSDGKRAEEAADPSFHRSTRCGQSIHMANMPIVLIFIGQSLEFGKD